MSPASEGSSGLRFRAWNLLLLVPLLILITGFYNTAGPALFGVPFFYWFQFLGIVVGVACTSIVYLMTRDAPAAPAPGAPLDADELDEGTAR